jgi:hypothetical protein
MPVDMRSILAYGEKHEGFPTIARWATPSEKDEKAK